MEFAAKISGGHIDPLAPGAVAVKLAKFKPGAVLTVTVESERKIRTLSQNARYWKLIVPAFSEWTGYEAFPESAERMGLAPKDSAHEVLKAMFLPAMEATTADGTVLRYSDGAPVMVRPSTAKLTVAQFADLQERAERFLNSQGVFLPADEPSDRELADKLRQSIAGHEAAMAFADSLSDIAPRNADIESRTTRDKA